MKLVHYLAKVRLAEGGVCRAVLDLCAVMALRGHEVVLLTHDPLDVPVEWAKGVANTPRLCQLDPPSLPLGLFRRRSLDPAREVIAGADAIHLHTPWETSNVQMAAMARRLRVPYIVSIHGMLDDWCMATRGAKKRVYLALMGRRLLELAAFVHCTAEAELAQGTKWFPKGKGAVIPLVLDLAPYRILPGEGPARAKFAALADGLPVVLFLSRIHPKKGVDLLIKAGARLRDRGLPFRMIIAGPGESGYEDAMRALVRQSGLAETADFVGMVSGVEKISLYQSSGVFVLPTSQENFGFVLVEALACGVPVVTTKGVDIWPELQASGAPIAERSVDAIADAIASLLADSELRSRMGAAGRGWILQHLDPARVAEMYESLYRTVQAGKHLQPS